MCDNPNHNHGGHPGPQPGDAVFTITENGELHVADGNGGYQPFTIAGLDVNTAGNARQIFAIVTDIRERTVCPVHSMGGGMTKPEAEVVFDFLEYLMVTTLLP